MKKRLFAILCAVAMLITFMPVLDGGFVFAASNPYNKNAKGTDGNWANCTWWAWQLAYDNTGVALPSWGNAKTWYSSASAAGYSVGTTPRAKSIVVYGGSGYGHVAYVADYNSSNGQIYVKEGGYINTADGYNETGWRTVTDPYHGAPIGYIYLYSPAYSTKPTNVSLALEKTTFAQNEHVTYYCDGKSVHYFIISIYKGDGTLIETVQVNPGEYCTRYYDPGQYTAYCEAYNNCGNTFSNTINFTVTAPQGPSNVSLALEKKTFFSDEHVTYYCSGTNASYFIISIYDSNGNVLETPRVNPGEYCTRYYDPGQYIVYCEAYNDAGKSFSNTINFTVIAPTAPKSVFLDVEKESFYTDEEVNYSCTGEHVEYFIISIYDDKGNVLETVKINPGQTCARSYSAGNYIAYCEAFNKYGESFSNTVNFSVSERDISHSHNLINTPKKAATTTSEGNIEYWTCSSCGKIFKDSAGAIEISEADTVIPMLQCTDHNWDSGTVTKAATCTEKGVKIYKCSTCGTTKLESISATGHKWGAWVTTKEPTTTATGIEERKCSVCATIEQNVLPKITDSGSSESGDNPTDPEESTDPTKPVVTPTGQNEKIDLPAVTISSAKAAKKAATVKWKKVSKKNQKKIAKLQIQYSTDKSFKTGVKTTTVKKTAVSKKIKKLTSKKTYYFRIRAYRKVGNVVHISKWSKIKKAKIK